MAQGHEAEDLFDAVASEVGLLLGADATRLLRYNEDGSALIVAAYGESDAQMGVASDRDVEPAAAWQRMAQTGGPERRVGATVVAPIVVSGRPWGVIVAAWKRADVAPAGAEARMAQFTELVATAIANAESRAELAASRGRIVATADAARRRIERDLHDGAQQSLVQTVMTLKVAEQRLAPENGNEAQLVGEALQNAERAIDEMRELARGIHPRILSHGGLGPALKRLAARAPVPVKIDLRSDARLPEEVEVTVYYIVSEALTNTAKHAQASEVSITVDVDESHVRITISDDGVGCADASRGSGLIGLRDRVEALRGSLEVLSAPGSGTTITAQIPVAAPADAGPQRPQMRR